MTITAIFPSQTEGTPYLECVTLTGTQPFTIKESNLGSRGTVSIIGSQLCVSIPSPSGPVDFAVTVASSCTGCLPQTVKASIGFVPTASCECVPAGFVEGASTCIQSNEDLTVSAIIELTGTAEGLEFCGDALPNCLGAKFVGSSIVISGKLVDPVFPIKFPLSVKNSCGCGCVNIEVAIVDSTTFCLKEGWTV